jgi:hypothetical protein
MDRELRPFDQGQLSSGFSNKNTRGIDDLSVSLEQHHLLSSRGRTTKEWMMGCLRRLIPWPLSFGLLLGAAPSASAGPITLNYTAVVSSSIMPGLVTGDLFSGTFTYDSVGVDTLPLDPANGNYFSDPSFAFSILSAGYSFQGSSFASTQRIVNNDLEGVSTYQDVFLLRGTAPLVATQTVGYELESVRLAFDGFLASSQPALPLNSDAIPTALNFADWEFNTIFLTVRQDGGLPHKINATITSLKQETPVPEPTTLLLLSTALGVGTLARKRFRKF